jgi:chromosome segregation ATPase
LSSKQPELEIELRSSSVTFYDENANLEQLFPDEQPNDFFLDSIILTHPYVIHYKKRIEELEKDNIELIDEITKINNDKEQQIQQYQNEYQELKHQNDAKDLLIQNLRQQIETKVLSSTSNELEQLQIKYDKLSQQFDEKKEQLIQKKTELSDLTIETNRLKFELKRLQNDYDKIEKQMNHKDELNHHKNHDENAMKQLIQSSNQLQLELNTKNEMIMKLQNDLKLNEKKIFQYEMDHSSYLQKISSLEMIQHDHIILKRNYDALEFEVRELMNQNTSLRAALTQSHVNLSMISNAQYQLPPPPQPLLSKSISNPSYNIATLPVTALSQSNQRSNSVGRRSISTSLASVTDMLSASNPTSKPMEVRVNQNQVKSLSSMLRADDSGNARNLSGNKLESIN